MDAVKKVYQYAEPNLSLVGWMGAIGFPLYYLIWQYIYPQPYEDLLLRSVCSVMLLVLALREFLPATLQRYMPYYYLGCVAVCLPFFFSYMLFKNHWSTVWAMSFMASIFLHVLLVHETRVMLAQAFVAVGFAYLFAGDLNMVNYNPAPDVVWPYTPIFLFTYVFGNLFYFRNQVEHEAKVAIAKSFGAGIAHEMRNPLSALKASVDVVNSSLPDVSHQDEEVKMSKQNVQVIKEILNNADVIINNGNEAIDLLLTSIDQNRVSRSTFVRHSAAEVVEDTLESFSYPGVHSKNLVSLHIEHDFDYFGSDVLLKYALYNLLKNAFYYQNSEDFSITVTLAVHHDVNTITVRDTGVGIEPKKLQHIFKDFYTSGKSSSHGLGLPFCKRVMHSFGGSISCQSEYGEWTEFTLFFPNYVSEQVSHIKHDLMKDKAIVYIGEDAKIMRKLNEDAFYSGFKMIRWSYSEASAREEFEFEYDLIFVDLDGLNEAQFKHLESKLHFTEAKLVYLFEPNRVYHDAFNRYLTFYPLEKQRVISEGIALIDEVIFDSREGNRNLIPRKRPTAAKRIMIADDNSSLRSLTAILLSKQGYQVIEAQDGNDVLEKLDQEPVDLVIMDIEMPKLDGFDTTQKIRHSQQSYANVPIVGHTGDNRKETMARIKEVGMNDYLIKPADKEHLFDKISEYL